MLRDYEPRDPKTDHFHLNVDAQGNPRFNPALAFPCCCCTHGDKDQGQLPCNRCGHNANAQAGD